MTPPDPPRNRPITERATAVGRGIGGRTTMPPQQYPAAEPEGDVAEARRQRFSGMAADVSAIEELVREALVEQERRLMLRLDASAKAEESAALTLAHRQRRRAVGLAISLGTALGVAVTVFATAWTTFRSYRDEATQAAAVSAVEAVAPTVAPSVAPLAQRVDQHAARLEDIDQRLGRLESGLLRVLELLEEKRGR